MCSPNRRSSWRHSWNCHVQPDEAEKMTASTLSLGDDQPPQTGSGWSRSAGGRPPPRNMVAGSTLRPPTPEISRTAPTTPVRELKTQEKQETQVLTQQSSKFSSTPALEPTSNTEWYIKDWVTYSDDKENLVVNKEIPVSQKNIPGESVLQKFRKSFSLKFHKKGQIKDCDEEETSGGAPSVGDSPPSSPHNRSQNHLDQDKEKFRFGPLVWRSSKERKKGKKAARSAKCNSGDSGIQIEMSSKIHGDSSESHDTDHLADEETLDDLDSPPVVRRRGTGSSSEGKPSRPTSDVINQVLIDKLKADLQACRGLRRANVRRTHSDLGGQRLYNWDPRRSYRRLYSSPSPIKSRVMSSATTNDPARTNLTEAQIRHLKRMRGRPTRLRRSVSQPLGINELSPLVRRKPSGGIRQNVFSEDERGGATTDDEMHSDSESSVTSLTERKKSFEMAMDEDVVILAEAVWDHVAMEKEELGFRAGDVIEVLDTLDKDWWWGTCNNSYGWFPSPFVRLRVSQQETVEDCLAAVAEGRPKSLRRRQSVSLLSNDQVRSKVVTELLNTERDFVKILRDVIEGYLVECRKRKDMFSEEQIQSIFSNLEDLLDFQDKFLQDLETRVDWEAPHRSCVAQSFINYKSGFRMYSEYCNSQPMAIATLQELYQHVSFSKFFEACRLMRGLIEIPLDGYLLTPVQRICKYPLQLAELLKYTKTEHADHDKLVEAHEAMRDVAVLINERKRRMESLEKLAAWQLRLDGWEGEDLIESSSQLIHQGDAIRVTTGMWTNNITLFLFDHQLIYCKKDILKRNTYVYKGRMNMDTSEVINLNDGKEPVLGVTVRHGIKVYSCVRDKWLVFCLRTAEEKSAWLEALARERCLVDDDMRDGIEFAPADRQLAKLAAIRHSTYTPPIPGKSYKLSESAMRSRSLQRGSTLQQQPQPESTQSLGRRVGTWFNFGGNKKWRSGSSGSGIRSATLHAVHPT